MKKPPKPPPKKTAKPKPAPAKAPPRKVVPITGAKKAAAKKAAAKKATTRKPKRPNLLIFREYRNQPVGPKLYTRASIYEDDLPDPERVLEEHRKFTKDEPNVAMRRAVVKSIRKGAPVREALANYGITEGQFIRWRERAQRDYEDGARSTPFLDFVRVLEIAEAQGEVMTAQDARLQPENTMGFLREIGRAHV